MLKQKKGPKQRVRLVGIHLILLAAVLATSFLPVGTVSAGSITPRESSPASGVISEDGQVSFARPAQREIPTSTPIGRQPTPTPTLPPRYTPTSPPPPRRDTPTATLASSLATPTPTPTATGTSEAPVDVVPYSGTNTLTILGCDPPAEEVKLTFRRIYRNIQASGESIRVPVQPGGASGLFVFDPPPAKPGDLFALDLHLNSPDCPTGEESGIDNWTPGSSIHTTFALPGGASLLASSLGKTIPGAQMGEVFAGGVWTTDIEFSTSPKGNYQTFKWETVLPNIQGGKLQASLMPFPSKTEGDLFSPPGLVVEWDVTCVNCTFTVDVSSLAIEPPAGSQSQPAKQNFLQQAWQAAGKVFNQLLGWVKAIFTKQTPEAPGAPIMTGASQQPGNFVNLVDTGKIMPPLITTYYFRIIPVYNQQAAGSASNPVRIQWYGEDPLADVIKKGQECQQNPSAPGCPTPVPPPLKPFIVEIAGYHGIVAPKNGHVGCYLVTKDTTVKIGGVPASYKAGDKFCPPKPKSKSWYEAVVDFVVDAVNWVSTAYNDLKDTVVSIVANFVPDVICNKACLGTLLDAGLMALGIPPSIPNFDQLMNEGLEYLASQAAAQLNIPPEVTDAIKPGDFLTDAAFDLAVSEAEAAWRAEAEKQLKQGLQQGLEAAQYALSSSVSWIPDGVPVKPDPFGDYQPPTMMLKVTRDPTVPLEADFCSGQPGQKGTLFIDTTVVVSAEHAQNFNDWISSTKQKMKADYAYYLYESMYVPLPQLGLGETQLVPVVLKPTINNYWGNPWTSYNDAQSAWSTWYWNGEMDLWVYNPCSKSASILGDPNQSFGQ
jgi:hypothetical protein